MNKKRAGYYRTNLTEEAAYQSFVPSTLPPKPAIELDQDIISLLIKANIQISTLNEIAKHIPNMNLFVSMYVRKEALMSSQIEGIQATLEDVFDPTLDTNRNHNTAEVINYIKAAEYAIRRLETLPLCNRLLRETHAILMENVRGQEKNPGEFRHSQNWIGVQDSTLKTARYIPPAPEDIDTAISKLEKYINEDDSTDNLIRAALIHYQFETIHPFLDGNGRIGRLLITLYLMEKKLLSTPTLYISYFLKRNRIEYYDLMTEVRNKGDYEQWIRFFLQAVYECAANAIATIDKLAALHEKNEAAILEMGRGAKNALSVFHYLEANPIIDIRKTAEAIGLSFNTVAAAVKKLTDMKILTQTNAVSRNRTFAYTEYLDLLRDGT